MKVVFVLNALHMQRCVKRIDEVAGNGYQVEAYGFDRGVDVRKRPVSCGIEVIGCINNSTGYIKRLSTIYNGIKSVLKSTKGEDVVYYLFGLDNAMFFMLQSRKKFIYEESDLVHTYMKSGLARKFFEWVDNRSIRKSELAVFTSEGFIRYHFGTHKPMNSIVIANRLPLTVNELTKIEKKQIDLKHLSIGFVGFIRFKSIFNFSRVFCEKFPNHEFHFYGTIDNDNDRKLFAPLQDYINCHFHGVFQHPNDLPAIYSQLDLVLSTYDVENENVRYAEPNKIYEAIYFKTPIIVSSGTYLAEKTNELGIGYDIDAMDDEEVIKFVGSLTVKSIKEKMEAIERIDPQFALNVNDEFFEKLKCVLER